VISIIPATVIVAVLAMIALSDAGLPAESAEDEPMQLVNMGHDEQPSADPFRVAGRVRSGTEMLVPSEDPGGELELLQKLKGKITHIHLIDSDGSLNEHNTSTHNPFGTGHLNFDELIPALQKAGVQHQGPKFYQLMQRLEEAGMIIPVPRLHNSVEVWSSCLKQIVSTIITHDGANKLPLQGIFEPSLPSTAVLSRHYHLSARM
jgi:hypothetical protein